MMGDEDDFDENDMMAAMAAEQAESGGSDNSDANDGADMSGASNDGGSTGASIGLVSAVEKIGIDITAVLGTADMKVSNLLKIGRGAVIELDKKVGDTIELHVSGKPIARGEVVVVEDHLAVSVTEVFKIGMFHET